MDSEHLPAAQPEEQPEEATTENETLEFTATPDVDKVDTQGLIGEVESETPPGENEDFAPTGIAELQPLSVSENLKKLISERISCLIRLDQLDAARRELSQQKDFPDNLKNALAAQSAEAKALPPLTTIKGKQTAFIERVKTMRGKFSDPENPVSQEVIAQTEQTWRLAIKQYEILTERCKLASDIISEIAAAYCPKEPLFIVAKHYNYPVERVFALAIYQLAIGEWQNHLINERKTLQQQLNDLNANKALITFGHKKEQEEQQKIQDKIDHTAQTLQYFSREIASLQKDAIDEYWKLYEFIACLHVTGKPSPEYNEIIRMTLRFGLLGHAPYFLAPQNLQFIRDCCRNDTLEKYDFAMSASHVVYADEYLRFIVNGSISASIDENLELAGRMSPEWHNDKYLRRLAYGQARLFALRERIASLQISIETLREQQQHLELKKSKLFRNDKEYKRKNAELAQKIQHCKVEAARFERVMNRINDQEIPALQEKSAEAREKLAESPVKVAPFDLTRKEVAAVHRVCRLCARLKDSFPPFSLRDYFRPENKTVNDRTTIQGMLKEIEECDRYIFQDILVNSPKAAQRITLRFHPVFLLAPNFGFLGYSWNPRAGMETGKLVFPLYCPRQGISTRILYNMLADFQWDTSKATAGVDLLTSDTLVAAYAGVRWDYRKRKKENREKALIFNEINDRQNWRRHYELFLESAKDSGRKLFFKNPEVYEVVVKYLGLPPGCEKLRH